MKFWTLFSILVVAAGLMTAPAKAETIRFAVTDVEGVEQLQREYGAFVEELEKATGIGRASCRERVEIAVVAGSLKKREMKKKE